jgi:hypothetical protein
LRACLANSAQPPPLSAADAEFLLEYLAGIAAYGFFASAVFEIKAKGVKASLHPIINNLS